MALFRKKQEIRFDPVLQEPAIRKSICTGEMTAGFIDRSTGKFLELMRVKDAEEFAKAIGTSDIKLIY